MAVFSQGIELMDIGTLSKLAIKHTRNAFAEELYLQRGKDITQPISIYGLVNERCNYKCRYCDYWRLPNYKDEMPIESWQNALGSLKEFIGSFHVEFSGGEPFIKQGFLDLCTWCRDNEIKWGVTTNGSALTPKNIQRIIAAKPFNINISMDSHIAEIHDYARGIEGSLEKISGGIRRLVAERNAAGLDFPVIVKPVVHRLNYRTLPGMLEWVKALGVTAINFQPLDVWTEETKTELWIGQDEIEELMKVAAKLIKLKQTGEPILNSQTTLSCWDKHFLHEKAPEDVMPCRVGMRNYFIRANGDVQVCWHFPPIGNVMKQNARDIWYGELGAKIRADTVACNRLCLFTCLSQKTIADKVKMGLTLLTGSREGKKGAL